MGTSAAQNTTAAQTAAHATHQAHATAYTPHVETSYHAFDCETETQNSEICHLKSEILLCPLCPLVAGADIIRALENPPAEHQAQQKGKAKQPHKPRVTRKGTCADIKPLSKGMQR